MGVTIGGSLPTNEQAEEFRQAFGLVGISGGEMVFPDNTPAFPALTWAELQAIPATENTNRKVFVTDIGINGCDFISNGTFWRPCGPVTLIASHESVTTSDATDTETDVFVYTIPAGLLTSNSLLKIYPAWTFPSSATTKEVKIYVGGTIPFSKSRTTSTHEVPIVELVTTNSISNVKFLLNPAGTYGSGQSGIVPTATMDLSQPIVIRATSRWGTAGSGSNVITFHKCAIVLEY